MPRQFLYNAYAVGFSGRIRAPFDEVIESQASSTLGVTGGYASARVENFRRHEIFSFASVHTQVSGIASDKSQAFETMVTGVMEGLTILDMVKVDYMAGRLMSRHPYNPPPEAPDEPAITPVGSHYGKVVVGGFALTPVIDVDVFNDAKTLSYTKLCEKIASDRDLRGRFNVSEKTALPPARGILVGSVVREIQGGGPGLTITGNMVHVPGFGKLHFGEFVMEQYSRRLIMMRAELGCPVQLNSSGPDMGGNGLPPAPA
jgi:hypothetical protein